METRYRGGAGSSKHLLSDQDLPSTTFDLRKESKFRNGLRSPDEPLFPKQLSLLIITTVVGGCFFFIQYIDNKLPVPLNVSDLQNNPNSFIEQRARNDLSALSGLGPRVCGSHANDVQAVELLLRQLKEIQRTKKAIHNIEIDVTKNTGQFHLDFFDGMTSSYASVPNVIAKLEPAAKSGLPRNDAILINCHFDSVPGSPGASDDLISCVTMMEVLRTLSKQPTALKNTIVFLFNGAEENFLQASHGFLEGKSENSQEKGHKWAKNIRTFINLEAAGAGGREILFQTGPGNGWLVQAYANSVPYPFGSAIGEEIFQNGLIPSDTDYRIFRDYSHIPGLDMAFIKNGYVYHTKYDEIDQITPGSVQHIGSNVLALAQTLGNLDYSQIEFTQDRMVFFDIFGFFMITYSERVGIIVNVAVALITLVVAWNDAERSLTQLFTNVLATLAAWSIGILMAVVAGVILSIFKYNMPYYSYPSLAYLIFGIPALVGQVLTYSFILKGSEDYSWIAAKTTLAIMILCFTFFTRIVFMLTINVGFGLFGWYASRKLFADSQRRLLFYLAFGELFPLSMSFYLSSIALDVFVPVMGRSGSETNPNVLIAFLTSLIISVTGFTGLVPVFVFLKKTFLRAATVVYIAVILGIIFAIGKVPYGQKTPMRLHIADVERQWFDTDLTTVTKTDAGYWFFTMDPSIPNHYGSWSESIPELERIQKIDSRNCSDLNCALPFVFPIRDLVRHTEWVPKASGLPPHLKQNVQMKVTKDEFISHSRRRLAFSFVGPDHLVIILSPGPNYTLVKWSLTEETPQPSKLSWNDRRTFFIYHARGINMETLEFSCDFEKGSSATPQDSVVVDINYSAMYMHGDDMQTRNFQVFQNKFPDWTYVKGWSAITNMYRIKQ